MHTLLRIIRRFIALTWLFLCQLRRFLHPRQTKVDNKQSCPALLPMPVARTISLATRATRLAVQIGSVIGTLSLDITRIGTISGLVIVRGIIKAALSRTAKKKKKNASTQQQQQKQKQPRPKSAASSNTPSDVDISSRRSLESLHCAISRLETWTSVSFRLASTTLFTASRGSQSILTALDQLFGSTDSSRAIASIITVLRRELLSSRPRASPGEGGRDGGERVRVADLIQALGTLAYLQHSCQRTAEEDCRRRSLEDTVHDVVIFSDGDRIGMGGDSLSNVQRESESGKTLTCSVEDDEALMSHLRSHIWSHLPPRATVSVSNLVSCIQTIGLDIKGPQLLSLPTPPGLEFVESRILAPPAECRSRVPCTPGGNDTSMYRVVYKIHRRRFKTLSLVGDYENWEPCMVTPGSSSSPKNDEPEVAQGIINDDDGSSSYSPISCSFSPTSPQSNMTSSSPFSPMSPSPTLKLSTNLTSFMAPLSPSPVASPTPTSALGGKSSRRPSSFQDFTRPTMSSSRRHTESANQRRSRTTPLHIPRSSHDMIGMGKQSHAISNRAERSVAGRTMDWERKMGAKHVLRGSQSPAKVNGRESGVEDGPQAQSPNAMDTIVSSEEEHASQQDDPLPSPLNEGQIDPRLQDPQSPSISPYSYRDSSCLTPNGLCIPQVERLVDNVSSNHCLVSNMMRYLRFCSACQGPNHSGVSWNSNESSYRNMQRHTDDTDFQGITPLASFVDSPPEISSRGSADNNAPLYHHLSLDHQAKAVVLACVSSTGLEEVMAQLAVDYNSLAWQGRAFNVHKGVYASARRVLYGDDGRVLETMREALHEFPDYGLVLCGHSWGAGVASVLGVMLSEPNPRGSGFVISTEPYMEKHTAHSLPTGRRIQVYAFGSPGVMSPSLSKLTRGLITSLVYGNDIVPHLSLGLLHSFQNLALAFRHDRTQSAMRRRVWTAIQDDMSSRWYGRSIEKAGEAKNADEWMLPTLTSMRAAMKSEKLVPPGQVFIIDSQPIPQQEAPTPRETLEQHTERTLRRMTLKRVKDVEARFEEVRFGTSLLTDHSLANYEDAVRTLMLGLRSHQ